MAKTHQQNAFEQIVSDSVVKFLRKQYRAIENAKFRSKIAKLKATAIDTTELDEALSGLSSSLATIGIASGQLPVAAAALIPQVVRLIAAIHKILQQQKLQNTFVDILYDLKLSLELMSSIEKTRLDLETRLEKPVSTENTIDIIAKKVAVNLARRHKFFLSDQDVSLKAHEKGTGRFSRFIQKIFSKHVKNISIRDLSNEGDLDDFTLDNRNIVDFLLSCAFPPEKFDHFYHKTLRSILPTQKTLQLRKDNVYLTDVFFKSAIVVIGQGQPKIFLPSDVSLETCKKLPVMLTRDISYEFGSRGANYGECHKASLKDFGLDEGMLADCYEHTDLLDITKSHMITDNASSLFPRPIPNNINNNPTAAPGLLAG